MRRFCLALHTQGQVTSERLTDLLNAIGLSISKREVVRLLTTPRLTSPSMIPVRGMPAAPL